jgi:glyoxylase-like metal-dependent hydrolase (beta-lactamase superfamily II)
MTKIKVLIEGYVKEDDGAELASSSVTLLQENGLNIIVDPGMDRPLLLQKLKDEGLTPQKINYVVLTHTHLDHCLLAGIFENAKIVDNDSIYSFEGSISSHEGKVPETDIEIIATPGHDQFHCAVAANTEEFGKVAVVGDVFWWRTGEEQKTNTEALIAHKDPYMKNEEQLARSRKKVLEIADYIVPGHGKMFKVRKF